MGQVGHRHRKNSLDMTGRQIAMRRAEEKKPILKTEEDLMVGGEAGSVALEHRQRESFCKHMAGGMDKIEAWFLSHRDEVGKERGSRAVANSAVHKLMKIQAITDRINWLAKGDTGCKMDLATKNQKLEHLMEKLEKECEERKASPHYFKMWLEYKKEHDAVQGIRNGGKQEVSIKITGLDRMLSAEFTKKMRGMLELDKKDEQDAQGEVIDG